MKSKTKSASKKTNSKTRLICVSLSESLFDSARKYRRQSGFSSMSELLRASINYKSSALLKKKIATPKKQVSFRLSESLYFELTRAADNSGQSVARIIRTLLENAPKIGIRPPRISFADDVPETKPKNQTSEKD